MKSMHIDAVVNFPFPTPPDRATLFKAEKVLGYLGALGVSTSATKGLTAAGIASVDGQITELGRMMSLFPLSPRFSRMLVSGQQQGCLPYIISIVSALSVGDPFLHDEVLASDEDNAVGLELKEAEKSRRKAFFTTQHVIPFLSSYLLSNLIARLILHLATSRAMCLEFCLSLARTSLQAVATNSARSTSSDQRRWKKYTSCAHK
jgi:ATP-dependent RNA helicase DHX37/DHR1